MKKILMVSALLTTFSSSAFELTRVVLATDDNPDYIQFWPVVAQAWRDIVGVKPTLALIASDDVLVDESLGDVIRFKPVEGIPTSFQAQVIRLLLPALFPDDYCIISDIDMIPLQKNYFKNPLYDCPEDSFVVYRDGAYHASEEKYPMCYLAARGSVFKEIFQVQGIDSLRLIISQWYALNLGWNTDELLLYRYLQSWSKNGGNCIALGHGVVGRIDRSYWNYDTTLLKSGECIDAHCPRPYALYKQEIDAIVATIKEANKEKISGASNKAIKMPARFLDNADYGTHMVPLITAVLNTEGPVLEMGSGDFSTPLLHALCAKNKRYLLTTDTDKKWLNNFIDLNNEWHEFRYVPVYEDDWSLNPRPGLWNAIGNNHHWSVVLVDHRPGERRADDIRRLRKNTDIFVVHDTQQPSYCYEPVLNTFKYKYVYERYSTQTTIVSDTIDIAQLFEK